MPPTRSIPPAKAVKTERTHEENQERAYIAASRRSDRSLEARVESARRASEIHKRRTGRGLRVREEDVQNEEMYEEEDDDLPLQYRRLTAHLQTGSVDFNRRLSAYLTNHVAMRSALEQSIHNSYAQQFPNSPQYAHHSMFPSPMLAHQQQQQQQQMMQPPQSPSMYGNRQQPYTTQSPRMQQQGFSLNPHQRSNSFSQQTPSTPLNQDSPSMTSDHSRSLSMSAAPELSSSASTGLHSPATAGSNPTVGGGKPSFPPGSFSNQMQQQQQQQNQFTLPSYDMGAFAATQFPSFTTQLPNETQAMFGGAFDTNDPLTSMMMAGSGNLPGNTFDFNNINNNTSQQQSTQSMKHQNQQPSLSSSQNSRLNGLSTTLAPSALDKPSVSSGLSLPSNDDNTPMDSNQTFFDNAMAEEGHNPGSNTPGGTIGGGGTGDEWEKWINNDDVTWGDYTHQSLPSSQEAAPCT